MMMGTCNECHAYNHSSGGCCYKGGPFERTHTCASFNEVDPFIDNPVPFVPLLSEHPNNPINKIVKVAEVTPEPTEDELFEHQLEAIDQYECETEIALFWEMGVGKSATALRIAQAKFENGDIDALLIVAPNEVHKQWAVEQVPKWLTCKYEVQCFGGRGGQKTTHPFWDATALHVLCVNIDTFSTAHKWEEIAEWANTMDTMIVLDEATCIKNVKSQRTQRMLYEFNNVIRNRKTIVSSKIISAARCVLTGTPVTNGPMDLWSIMEFLKPNFFGRNWYSFQSYFGMFNKMQVERNDGTQDTIDVPINEEVWGKIKAMQEYTLAAHVFGITQDTFNVIHSQSHYQGPYKHADELKQMLSKVASFKLLRDCVDMPETFNVTRRLQMNDELARVYEEMQEEMLTMYEGKMVTALNKLTLMIRLQQISSGFISSKEIEEPTDADDDSILNRMYGLDYDVVSTEVKWIGKSNPKLDALYRDVDEASKPLIIITRFSCEAERIYDDLSKKYKCCLMTGWKKVGTIEDFKSGVYEVMVANMRVISRGFNLQNSHQMLFYSNTFSLEDRLQVEGRIFRIGQKNVCEYVDYVYENSIDYKVIAALQNKKHFLDYIRGADMEVLVR